MLGNGDRAGGRGKKGNNQVGARRSRVKVEKKKAISNNCKLNRNLQRRPIMKLMFIYFSLYLFSAWDCFSKRYLGNWCT